MNTSITIRENIQSGKNKLSNRYRKEKLPPLIKNKKSWSTTQISKEIIRLCDSINNITHQPYVTLDEVLKSSTSDSTLGKLYQLFTSIVDNKDNLVSEKVFKEMLMTKSEGLLIKINPHALNFTQFINEIERIAKENQLPKEYLFEKILRPTIFVNTQNQNNNALDSYQFLLTEYNNDFSRLQHYFISHSEKNKSADNQMNCSTFLQCISQDVKLKNIDRRLDLNGIFYQVQSLLVDQGVYMPASLTIDFHGFLLCLQQIARIFHFNLRILIKNLILINKNEK